jgi:hypothetical protein
MTFATLGIAAQGGKRPALAQLSFQISPGRPVGGGIGGRQIVFRFQNRHARPRAIECTTRLGLWRVSSHLPTAVIAITPIGITPES